MAEHLTSKQEDLSSKSKSQKVPHTLTITGNVWEVLFAAILFS
jgi:hypothetical protein